MRAWLSFALLLVVQVEADRYDSPLQIVRRRGIEGLAASFTNSSTDTSKVTPTNVPPAESDTKLSNTIPLPTCLGSVTYTNSVPPTVYLTVTEGYNFTVTASNASVTAADTLITPLPACDATVIHNSLASLVPLATIQVTLEPSGPSSSDSPSASTSGVPVVVNLPGKSGQPNGRPTPNEPSVAGGSSQPTKGINAEGSVVLSTIYSSAAPYTSTVIVTKKTPVPVVVPPSSQPPVFQPQPQPTPNPAPGSPSQNSGGGSSQVTAPTTESAAGLVIVAPGTTTAIGNIIASIIKSPSVAPGAGAAPLTTTIKNIGVTVFPSSVAIGSQVVAIPASSQTTIRVNGETFTIEKSAIIGPGTTIAIQPQPVNQVITQAPTHITAAPGLVITIGSTAAVVAGTTYRIGNGASPTTIVVAGQTISLGPSGVGLSSTTVPAAGLITEAPYVIETAGGLTFSVGSTDVIVSGTTYRIGSGAPTITTVIGGQTVSIGPSGVGFKTTTLHPTTASTSARSGSRSTDSGAAGATSSAGLKNAGVRMSESRIPIVEMLGWFLSAFMLL